MAFTIFILMVVVISVLYKLFCPSYKLWKYGNKLPGPPPLPIVGNGFLFLNSEVGFLQTISNLCDKYGPVTRLWMGKQLFLVLSDPGDIEVFLTSTVHLDKTDAYRMLDLWLGNKGLLTSDADVWRTHRKLLTPSFHFKILESSVEMIQRNASVLCKQLECRLNGPEFNIHAYAEKCSLDIIAETAMGIRLEVQKSNNTAYLDAIKQLEESSVLRYFSPWLHSEMAFRYSSPGRNYYGALPTVKNVVAKVIRDRKRMLETAAERVANDDKSKKQLKPFLDFMLLESNFTDEEIENEVQTFLFAGHDTTTTTIAFCLYALSKHPDIQEKILEEIASISKDLNSEEFTYQDYFNMKYLHDVIKETMRMYTTVPFVSRKVAEDLTLPSGSTLPAGALVNFFLYYLHNNKKYFPNPDQFLPERFDNREDDRHPFAYIPFSAGPRNCIGQKFAMLEMKVVIASLIQKYRFLPAQKVQNLTLETGIVLRSLDKIPVRVVSRYTNK